MGTYVVKDWLKQVLPIANRNRVYHEKRRGGRKEKEATIGDGITAQGGKERGEKYGWATFEENG